MLLSLYMPRGYRKRYWAVCVHFFTNPVFWDAQKPANRCTKHFDEIFQKPTVWVNNIKKTSKVVCNVYNWKTGMSFPFVGIISKSGLKVHTNTILNEFWNCNNVIRFNFTLFKLGIFRKEQDVSHLIYSKSCPALTARPLKRVLTNVAGYFLAMHLETRIILKCGSEGTPYSK